MNQYEESKIREEGARLRAKTEVTSQFQFTPIADLMAREFPDTEWLVDQLIPKEGITALSGAPASFKTWIILHLAMAIASGDVVFEKFPAQPTGVLIVDEENGDRLLQRRLHKLPYSADLPITFLFLQGFKLTKETVKVIIEYAKQNNISFVIFDSLIRIHSQDENDAGKMSEVFLHLKELNKAGLSVLFTHHHRKQGLLRSNNPAEDMRGSSDIRASVDAHLAVNRTDKETLLITQTKNRHAEELPPFHITILHSDNQLSLAFKGEVDPIQTKKDETKKYIVLLLEKEGKPLFQKEIMEKLRALDLTVGEKTVRNALDELVEDGTLYTQPGEKNKTYYSLQPRELIQTELEAS